MANLIENILSNMEREEELRAQAIRLPWWLRRRRTPTPTPAPSATPSPGGGKAYYVSTGGSDGSPGTESQPWRTIQKAADTAVAGDTVYIKGGTYKERVIFDKNNGSSGKWILFRNYSNDVVVIDGSSTAVSGRIKGEPWEGLIDIRGRSYLSISGLQIKNSKWFGVYIGDGHDGTYSTNLVLRNNYIYNTFASGISVNYTNGITIDRNEIVLANNAGKGVETQEMLSLAYRVDGFTISNNLIHDGGDPEYGGEGIDVKYGASNGKIYNNHVYNLSSVGIYVDAWDQYARDIDVFNNLVHDINGACIGVSGEAGGIAERINIYNNIVYRSQLSGILVPTYGSGPIRDVKIINNTSYNNAHGGIDIGYWDGPLTNITVRNNIFSKSQSWQIRLKSASNIKNIVIDHNLIDGFRGFRDGSFYETRGVDYVEGDPKFVDASNGDFHLQGSSPAIDKGSSSGAPGTDYDGRSRPRGSGYDIGAYEY